MNTLSSKFALLLALAFIATSVGLMLTQMVVDTAQLPALLSRVVIGAVAFGLLAALCVFQLFSRRLARLAEAVEAFRQGGFSSPVRVFGADPNGDEIDRLAAGVEQLSEQLSGQLHTLERQAAQRHELLANVSHDLRTPLASMQGYLELLLLRHGSLEPAEALNYLQTAARHSERLGRLVGDLFDLTRLEEGSLAPQPEDFSPGELAQDVAQKFAFDARQRQVALHADIPAAPVVRVRADLGLIERVLDHLVENALQHTPAGGQVVLQLECDARGARFVVRDSGCGMSPEQLGSLFERYERKDRRGGGRVGLRLAITQRIVRLHGGQLEVRSAPGQGSRFSFALPLAGAPVVEGTEPCSPTP